MINSIQNSKIQHFRRLSGSSKYRRENNSFTVEGIRLLEDAVRAKWTPSMILYSDALSSRGQELLKQYQDLDIEIEEVSRSLLVRVLDTENPQGIGAIMPLREIPIPVESTFTLILDNIQDPGNAGTLIRTAGGAGVDLIIASPDTVDLYSPKVVRSTMGAIFRLPIQQWGWEEIKNWKNTQPSMQIINTDLGKGQVFWEADLTTRCGIIISNEARGVSDEAKSISSRTIHIPMVEGTESLNAAPAGSILLYEVVRQRKNR
jgi:TrmH family RNA methyltransferase